MPYGIDPAVWAKLPLEDQQAIRDAYVAPPAPPAPAPPPPPPPPAPAPPYDASDVISRAIDRGATADTPAGPVAVTPPPPPPSVPPPPYDPSDVISRAIGRGSIADTPAGPVSALPVTGAPSTPTAGETDSLDDEPDAEAGDEPSADDYRQLQAEADDVESGARTLAAVSHPAPGTLIGWPYVGTHAVAFNRAGGSDNWQSENAVDVWLYPGSAILAVAAGRISPGGYGYGLSSSGGRFAGWRLHLVTDDGKAFFYTHMSSLVAAKGARVVAGQLIGRSGIANGVPHLHFAARPPFDPRAFYKAAFSTTNRNPVADPVIGDVGVQGGLPDFDLSSAGARTAWLDLMRVYGQTMPAAATHARDARQQLHAAVS